MSEHVEAFEAECVVRLRNVNQDTPGVWSLAQKLDPQTLWWGKILKTTPTGGTDCEVVLALDPGWYRERTRGCRGPQEELAAVGRHFRDDGAAVFARECARIEIAQMLPALQPHSVGPYAFAVTWSVMDAARIMGLVAKAKEPVSDVRFTPIQEIGREKMSWAVSLPKKLFDDAYQILISGLGGDLAEAVDLALDSEATGKDILGPLDPWFLEHPF